MESQTLISLPTTHAQFKSSSDVRPVTLQVISESLLPANLLTLEWQLQNQTQ